MKITIVNGIKKDSSPDESILIEKQIANMHKDNQVTQYNVEHLNIHHCTGCWNCWMQNPGNCVYNDDMIDIYKSIVKSDLLIFVSTLKAGFLQSEIKRVLDRMFTLILPHMVVVKDELHHIPRYDSQPKLGLVLAGADQSNTEQDEILREFMHRLALNFNHGSGHFVHYLGDEKELINEIHSV